jgi:undecaprenyl diphosphate synthase
VNVAIIMDGNARWARAHRLPVLEGHRQGARALKQTVKDAVKLGIKELTVYAFSTENWQRPKDEVEGLMEMFAELIDSETPELNEEGVRMRFVGRRWEVSARLQDRMGWAERETAGNTRMTLFVAFNYGGRAEILDAAARFEGGSEEDFQRLLYAPEMSDPDLEEYEARGRRFGAR